MKFNIVIFFLIFNFSLFSQTEFKLSSTENISEFKIGSNVFDLMSKFKISFGDNGLDQMSDQLKKLTSIVAYSSDSLTGSSNIESSFNDYILNSELMQLIQFEENKYEVNIYTSENEDSIIEELSMIVKKEGSFKTIYLQIRGEIDLEQIASVASELNVPGKDFLNKIR